MADALHDPILVLLSFVAVALLVLAARLAAAKGATPATIRRFLHVGVGLWTLVVTTRFHHLEWALVPPLLFFGINISGRLGRLVPALHREGDPGSARGLWTFPLGVALAYLLFWDSPGRGAVLAGCAALALADPAAAWAGARFGQRRLRPLRFRRTLEGSLAFILVAAAATFWVAARASGGVAPVRLAIGCAAVGALAEALAPPGIDNAAIPLLVGAAYNFLD